MRRLFLLISAVLLAAAPAGAQADKKEIRAGNRLFRKGETARSEIEYRKAVLKDSLSVPAQYNLASSLYRQDDFEGASKALSVIEGTVEASGDVRKGADYYYNLGDVALAMKDYASAVKNFRSSLLLRPEDMDAKENYVYARKMLENQQNNEDGQGQGDGDGKQENEGEDPDDNQNDNGNRNQDQDGNDREDKGQNGESEGSISRQQARQMLNAIQAKEKETQDKVKKEKAEMLKSREKEKNW